MFKLNVYGCCGQKKCCKIIHMEKDLNQLSVISSLSNIVIFGASGWLGRECINILYGVLQNDFKNKVILVGSKHKVITIGNKRFDVRSINDLENIKSVDMVIDFAFITPEKFFELGERTYIEMNKELTNKVLCFIKSKTPKYIYYSSSGAADLDFNCATNNRSKKIYGQLKYLAEIELESISRETSNHLLINRIWSLTGSQIQDVSKFAIINFINQALENGKIVINSSDQTLRTYVDASEQLKICFNKLFESKLNLINSGGFQISLFDLANLIYKVLNIKYTQTRNFIEKVSGDDYISKDFILNELGTLYGVKLTSLEDQVKNTIDLIKSNKLKSI
jgi:nucleoside-diphosphate-sugar epimerase